MATGAADDDAWMSDNSNLDEFDLNGLSKGFLLNTQGKRQGNARSTQRHQSEPPFSTQTIPNTQTICGKCSVAGYKPAKRSIKEEILKKLATLEGKYGPDNEEGTILIP